MTAQTPAGSEGAGTCRLSVYLPSLSGGGVERMTLNLLPEFREQGFEVTIVLDRCRGELVGQVPSWTRIVELGASRTLTALPRLAAYLRRERPDVLLSSLGHNNVAALVARALARVPTRVIVRQHNFLSKEATLNLDLRYRLLPLLYRLVLPFADGIVAVSRGVADDMAKAARIDGRTIDVIYNPVVTRAVDELAGAGIAHPWLLDRATPCFLAIGRLVDQKDYPTLLRAFSRVRERRACRLLVLGNGPLLGRLQTQAATLGIGGDVLFNGYQVNPYPFIRHAAALVLSSRYEGFGNVLVEALACGTPAISTDCPAGPSEILEGGRYGRLTAVGDDAALAAAMDEVLASPPDHRLLREGADRFRVETIGVVYAALLRRVQFERKGWNRRVPTKPSRPLA
ncbi:MAG: glycosyltransferase [Geminicoccaceae bacterium]|nr:glycosyltransferase [Geminicoccaceae bacterium]